MARFVSNLSRRISNDWNPYPRVRRPFTRARSHRNARVHVATHHAFDVDRAVRVRVVVASRATRAGWREGTRSSAASTSPRASAGARRRRRRRRRLWMTPPTTTGRRCLNPRITSRCTPSSVGTRCSPQATEHGCETEQLVGENELGVRRSIEVGQILRVPVNVERASYTVRAKLTNAPLGNTPASSGRRKTSTRLGGLAPRAKMATTRRRVGRDHRVVTPAQTVGIGVCGDQHRGVVRVRERLAFETSGEAVLGSLKATASESR